MKYLIIVFFFIFRCQMSFAADIEIKAVNLKEWTGI